MAAPVIEPGDLLAPEELAVTEAGKKYYQGLQLA